MSDVKGYSGIVDCRSQCPSNCLLLLVEDMIVLLNENFQIQYASPAFLKVFAFQAEDLFEKSFLDFILPEEKYMVNDALECAMRNPEQSISAQYKFKRGSDGEISYYEMIIKKHLADNNVSFLLLDIRDITERVLLYEKIIEQEQRWKIIFENAKELMLVVDRNGTILAVNQALCVKLGYSEDDLFWASVFKIIAPQFWQQVKLRLSDNYLDEDFFESSYIRKDGTEMPVELSCSPIVFRGQNCVLAVIRDISIRKQLEGEKAQLQKQFLQAQKMETVGRLAAGIAHDFNNILTVIMNNLGLLAMDLSVMDPLRQMVDECQKAVEQAATLTKQLLTFSRPQLSDEVEIVNLGGVLKSMHSMLRRLLPENVHLFMLYGPEMSFIKMNKTNMEQILVNLVVNARDALPDGGKIIVSVKCTDGQVILSVSDNGVGIPLDIQDKIFEPFFSTKGVSGTGLGLFTVYGLVFKADGKINLMSSPGKGTTFELIFPSVSPPNTEHDKSLLLENQVVFKAATILVVEDDEHINALAVRILNRANYKVFSCHSGEEALKFFDQLAENQRIDLLFSDITMPGITGIQLAKKLREAGLVNRCLLTSGYVRSKENLQDIADNQTEDWRLDYISKPYPIPTLLAKIKNLLL